VKTSGLSIASLAAYLTLWNLRMSQWLGWWWCCTSGFSCHVDSSADTNILEKYVSIFSPEDGDSMKMIDFWDTAPYSIEEDRRFRVCTSSITADTGARTHTHYMPRLSHHLHLMKTKEIIVTVACLWVEKWTWGLPNVKKGC
jgi:hypothetical protein